MPQVQPLGGGAIKPMRMPKDPLNDMGLDDGNSAGPMQPTALPMPKPAAPAVAAPSIGGEPMRPTQQAAKPQQQGAMRPPEGMPPPIMAPRAPNYQAQTPSVPQIGTPSGPGYQPQTPSVPGITPGSQPSVQAPGVGAQQASAGRFDVEAFRPFADAVFSEATRQLDPMM
jgi:hypothetical protein